MLRPESSKWVSGLKWVNPLTHFRYKRAKEITPPKWVIYFVYSPNPLTHFETDRLDARLVNLGPVSSPSGLDASQEAENDAPDCAQTHRLVSVGAPSEPHSIGACERQGSAPLVSSARTIKSTNPLTPLAFSPRCRNRVPDFAALLPRSRGALSCAPRRRAFLTSLTPNHKFARALNGGA
jgi:hypothetical protein